MGGIKTKFYITNSNVDYFVNRLKSDYPQLAIEDIKCFFGTGMGEDWKFEKDWFPNEIDYATLVGSFEDWAFPQN